MWFDDVMAHRVDYVDAEFDKIAGPLKIVVHMPSTGLKDLTFDEKKDELRCKFESIEQSAHTVDSLCVASTDLPCTYRDL